MMQRICIKLGEGIDIDVRECEQINCKQLSCCEQITERMTYPPDIQKE